MAAAAHSVTPTHHARETSATRQRKKASVQRLAKEVDEHPVVAVVAIRGVPAPALQSMRRELAMKGNPIRVAPNSLITHALEQAAKNRPSLKQLLPLVSDQTAILLSKSNPFALYQSLEKTRQPAPARGGEHAPKDITVQAGETSFKPGPIVGELQHAGFPAAIEKGKVVLKKDATIVKQGGVISREVATMLTRLEILPLEVGLMLRGAVEQDFYYPRDSLAVDLDAIRADFGRAHRHALKLATELAWATPETMPLLLAQAQREARAVALGAAFPTPETVEALFIRAQRQAQVLEKLQTK